MLFGSLAYAAEAAEEVAQVVVPVTVGQAWDQLVSTIILAVLGLITSTILPYAVILARSWFKAKIEKIQNDELRAAADYAMVRLDRIVTNVVKEIQQTRPTDGTKLTKEQAKQLLSAAYNRVKMQVTDEIIDVVKTVVKDSDRYIITKIEASVGELKRGQITVENKTQ